MIEATAGLMFVALPVLATIVFSNWLLKDDPGQ